MTPEQLKASILQRAMEGKLVPQDPNDEPASELLKRIKAEKEKLIKEQTMKYFELHLPSNQFVRVHRSYIINVEKISRIELYAKQSQRITLHNGDQLKVSAAGYKTLRAALDL